MGIDCGEIPPKNHAHPLSLATTTQRRLTISTIAPIGLKPYRNYAASVPPYSPVPDIAIVACSRLRDEDGPFNKTLDWLIEIYSPDRSTLDLQKKILHCLSNGTQLAWLIDLSRQLIWVWQGDDLPLVCSGADILPALGILPELTVDTVMAMTRRQ